MQAHASSELTVSISVRPCEPYLVGAVGHVFLMSLISFDTSNIFLPSSMWFPEFRGQGNNKNLQFKLSFMAVGLCIYS